MRLLVRGFVCCVLATGARGQWYPPSSNVTVVYPPPAQNPPVVVVLDSPAPRPAEFREKYAPARQTTYLIAFKDSVVRVADQYWVNGKTIIFVTTDHQRMTAPVSSVDLTLSQRLNDEQNVVFVLPPEPGKTINGHASSAPVWYGNDAIALPLPLPGFLLGRAAELAVRVRKCR